MHLRLILLLIFLSPLGRLYAVQIDECVNNNFLSPINLQDQNLCKEVVEVACVDIPKQVRTSCEDLKREFDFERIPCVQDWKKKVDKKLAKSWFLLQAEYYLEMYFKIQ